jgi:protocatechuate 3,4-dioxygenase beta subunit
MDRRNFIKNSAFFAVAISTTGSIRFDNGKYIGDCETTSDILGPFYRPGAPLRNNFLTGSESDQIVTLSGTVRHKDCTTQVKGAVVELWHCNRDGVYDNHSDKFEYRGKVITDDNGKYLFKTILPVPYSGDGGMRPAHFHLMISADTYPSLITQVYFSGDKYIAGDRMAASPSAEKRIVQVVNGTGGEKKVFFDISMRQSLAADPAAIDKLTGIYLSVTDNKTLEIFKDDNLLWLRTELYGLAFEYAGNNIFRYPGINDITLKFELFKDGTILLTKTSSHRGAEPQTSQWRKKN